MSAKKKITEAFQRNAAFDAEKIKVETVGSKVILVGLVRSLAKKDDAGDAVWTAPGVMAIENKLIVEEDLLVFWNKLVHRNTSLKIKGGIFFYPKNPPEIFYMTRSFFNHIFE